MLFNRLAVSTDNRVDYSALVMERQNQMLTTTVYKAGMWKGARKVGGKIEG